MKFILDNVLEPESLAFLSRVAPDYGPSDHVLCVKDVQSAILPLAERVEGLTGFRGPMGAWFVLTQPRDPGSKPHYDTPGATAILHLSDITGGEFVFCEDGEEVEFKKNRMVVITEELEHYHRPPTTGMRRTLVMRFTRH